MNTSDTLFGSTRTKVSVRHALITPDGHVASTVPGAKGTRIFYHITPALGADLVQATLEMETGGVFPWAEDDFVERFYYVASGEITVNIHGEVTRVAKGGFAFCPTDSGAVVSAALKCSLVMFEKSYQFAAQIPPPLPVFGSVDAVKAAPFLGNPKAMLKVLLPESPAFDMAVNVFTYEPGATLPFVETHIMEHGLLMLSGQGIYRLEDDWYPVKAGDVIWMAPYCPQWFVAMGDVPASYLYYKNVNRQPL